MGDRPVFRDPAQLEASGGGWRPPTLLRRLDSGYPSGSGYEPPDPGFASMPIFEHFRRAVARFHDKIAVDDGQRRMTYAELLRTALQVAVRLAEAAPGPERAVGVLLPNTAWFPAATLACLATGRTCVALDVNQPAERNADIVRHARLAALIVQGHTTANALGPLGGLLRIEVTEALLGLDDRETPALPAGMESEAVDRPAFVLYTSGSTGRPKGIVNSQHALLHRVFQHVEACRIGHGDCLVPLSSPCTTIAGMRETLAALLTGAMLRVVDPQQSGLREIRGTMAEARATICYAVPSLLRALVGAGPDAAPFTALRVLRIGGEPILWSDVALLRRILPPTCAIMPAYSSTESPGAHWFLPPDAEMTPALRAAGPDRTVPYGTVVPGLDFAILDPDGAPVPDGGVGELAVRGRSVALGLWEGGRCVPGPVAPDPLDPRSRILRTGDLVALGADGLLRGRGRADRQAKVRGQRVEPAELEAVLLRSPQVVEAAVIVRRGSSGDVLVAFVSLQSGTNSRGSVHELAKVARAALPSALHPAAVHVLAAMPRLPSGKPDAGGLQKLDEQLSAGNLTPTELTPVSPPSTRPSDDVQMRVSRVWCRVLGLRSPVAGRSWEDSGGDSLRLLRFVFELEEALGCALSLDLLDARMDLTAVAAAVERAVLRPVSNVAEDEGRPMTVMLPGLGGDEPSLAALRGDLADRVRFLTVQYPDWTEMSRPGYAFADLVDAVCNQIRTALPDGPITLLGYSAGGLVALGVVEQLRHAGREIAFVGILDTDVARPRKARASGLVGAMYRLSNIPARVRTGELGDALARVVAHYMLASRLHGLSLQLTQRLPGHARFAVGIWMDKHRLADLVRPWFERHTPDLSGISVTVFRAERTNAGAMPGLGWERWYSSPLVVRVPGDHKTMLEPPNRHILAAEVLRALVGAEAAPGTVTGRTAP